MKQNRARQAAIGFGLACAGFIGQAQAAPNMYWSESVGVVKPPVAEALQVFSTLFKQSNPAVVNISTLQVVTAGTAAKPAGGKQQRKNLGSGVIIRADGYVLTNHHVIIDENGIAVWLSDGRSLRGKVVGSDALSDVALIKIDDPGPFPVLSLGDSSTVVTGEWVAAIGNPFGFNNTMTHGIVSAVGRVISAESNRKRFDDYIQIDASINPGNSGGPLLNTAGEVIGLNTAMTASGAGIAFAVPINSIKTALPDLYEHGYVQRGWAGIVAKEEGQDLVVIELVRGAPAEVGGLQRGDHIISLNDVPMPTLQRLSDAIAAVKPGNTAVFAVLRRGKAMEVKVKVGDLQSSNILP